jgi:hypothetical protein
VVETPENRVDGFPWMGLGPQRTFAVPTGFGDIWHMEAAVVGDPENSKTQDLATGDLITYEPAHRSEDADSRSAAFLDWGSTLCLP